MADPLELTDALDEDPAELRTALLDQLRYLIDEVEVLKPIVDRVPETVREGRPTADALSMKEIYGVIARMDERVHRPRIEQITDDADANPTFEAVDEGALVEDDDWNEMAIRDILDRVQSARRALVALLDALSDADWSKTGQIDGDERSVYEIAHQITQDDTQRLRTLGYRLHEANLTDRERDLPK